MTLSIELRPSGSGAVCHSILATISDWFGMPASNAEYEGLAETGPSVAVLEDGEPMGLMLLKRHFAATLEVYFLGVRQSRHRQGYGRALMAHAEATARAEGRRFVMVKTQGPSANYEPYDRTRRFYEALGYAPLEELDVGWGPENPTLIMAKAVAPHP
ncbi:MAG TPA: GNAT family N-acetyltransferase [Caulobacteraceae bacterium]|jgi:GNAT superfamily N-acetyltransferase|nr:GNAT family N-acetyltransferase [Caulobacteraceae bacterium]